MVSDAKLEARRALVREHVRCENAHDLGGIMNTFGSTARYDDEPWNEHRLDRNGVRGYYEELLKSVPDLQIDVQREHVTDDAVILEVVIRGTHSAAWRGLPGTGRRVAIPLCGIFTFDDRNRLAGEKIFYDRATVLRQLGVFREPQTLFGRLTTALNHPVTIGRALLRQMLKQKVRRRADVQTR